ncbi:MAG: GIY-YIG nuclease family protein [Flavobacteriales bacterium]
MISKDFWNEAIVFISKDANLNKAHVKYLENRFHAIAKSLTRCRVENSVVPAQSSISESDRAEMEEFIEYIKLLVNSLGHKVFEEKREYKPKQKQTLFFIKASRGVDGQREPISDVFVVLKGSKAAATIVNSMTPSFITYRQKLIDEGVFIDRGEFCEFTDDHIFSSPSTAAVMVMGRNANGLTEWKTLEGKTLKNFEKNERTAKPQ